MTNCSNPGVLLQRAGVENADAGPECDADATVMAEMDADGDVMTDMDDDGAMMAKVAAIGQRPSMEHRPVSFYVKAIKRDLPEQAFAPARSRLFWLPTHLAVITLGIICLAAGWLPWALVPGVSVLIGASFAGLTFLGHETLHGAVVRSLVARRLVGAICFGPFMISPRLWIAWHNRVHHGHTNRAGSDPDTYPTLDEYRQRRSVRVVTDHLGPGGSRPNGALSLLIGFSVQSAHMLWRGRSLGLSRSQHAFALLESGLAAAGWLGLGVVIGWPAFLFAFLLPLSFANAVVMGFILTNHSLSPQTEVNDPLLNSLSVTVPRWIDWCTLRFGFHVEHHLFPWMSSRHAPAVRELVRAHWPERYQAMPIGHALLALHRTGRVYKDSTTLADLPGGKEWPTLLPRDASQPAKLASRPPSFQIEEAAASPLGIGG
jgi:fatty acid desaturase